MSEQERVLRTLNVSRETTARLDALGSLLRRWTEKINLVSRGTLDLYWSRHVLDSAQLVALAPSQGTWADLGSGGGFPGLVVAIVADRPMILVESDQRKCAFLRVAARETGADVEVICARIEDVPPMNVDVLSARALAPLPDLLAFAERHLAQGGLALFPKGRNSDQEIADALAKWRFDCEKVPSKTDDEAVVLRIGAITRV